MLHPTCARVAVIAVKNSTEAEQQLPKLNGLADAVELRLDYWSELSLTDIAQIRRQIQLPLIMTLRKVSQGGFCQWPEEKRLDFIHQLAGLAPEYFDLEYDIQSSWLQKFHRDFPQIRLIGSYHDFNHTPPNFEESVSFLRKPEFDMIKLAYMAHDLSDALRLLIFISALSQTQPVIGIAMGEAGQISRIVAPIVGSAMTYGVIDEDRRSAPGQITLADLTQIYRVHMLNRQSHIYALLGDPIAQSPGHLFHNQAFNEFKKNAVYVKCRVRPQKLSETVSLIKQLPFYGMSVTIPHKETIAPLLDHLSGIASTLGIVNTINRQAHEFQGFNTDAPAAVEILEKLAPLSIQSILILGAGGSAKAIAYALLNQGGNVTLCNRTLARAQEFTEKWGGAAIDFSTLFSSDEFPYTIIINTLPAHAYEQQCILWRIPPKPEGIAMDIVLNPLQTLFIHSARASGWRCLTGDELYHSQAIRQLKIWFES